MANDEKVSKLRCLEANFEQSRFKNDYQETPTTREQVGYFVLSTKIIAKMLSVNTSISGEFTNLGNLKTKQALLHFQDSIHT